MDAEIRVKIFYLIPLCHKNLFSLVSILTSSVRISFWANLRTCKNKEKVNSMNWYTNSRLEIWVNNIGKFYTITRACSQQLREQKIAMLCKNLCECSNSQSPVYSLYFREIQQRFYFPLNVSQPSITYHSKINSNNPPP